MKMGWRQNLQMKNFSRLLYMLYIYIENATLQRDRLRDLSEGPCGVSPFESFHIFVERELMFEFPIQVAAVLFVDDLTKDEPRTIILS
jgi:hypothetical protein